MSTYDKPRTLYRQLIKVMAVIGPLAILPSAALSEPVKLDSGMFSRTPASLVVYAHCLVKRDRPKVETALALYGHSKKYYRSMVSLARPDCVVTGMQSAFSTPVLWGLLYAALYDIDYAETRPNVVGGRIDFATDFSDLASEAAQQSRNLRTIAQCIIKSDTAGSSEWVLHQSSDKIDGTIERIKPMVAKCSEKYSLSDLGESTLIGLVSEVLYRETVAALLMPDRGIS